MEFWSSNYGLIDFQVWKETAPNVYELTHTFNYYVPEGTTWEGVEAYIIVLVTQMSTFLWSRYKSSIDDLNNASKQEVLTFQQFYS